jgi:hypothetical protein
MKIIAVSTIYSFTSVVDRVLSLTLEEQAAQLGAFDPADYAEFPDSDFDAACYNFPGAFTLSGGVVSFSLPSAKASATSQEKVKYGNLEQTATEGYSANQLSSQASLPAVDRIPSIQLVLDAVNTLAVELENNLIAIDSATDINEVNNIVNPPTGIINIGRGQFGGPLDLNASNYVEFNSASMTEAETELYAPATSSVVPYQGFPPDDFNSSGAIFATGDYLIQIRETATSRVIAEFEVPLSLDGSNEDITF